MRRGKKGVFSRRVILTKSENLKWSLTMRRLETTRLWTWKKKMNFKLFRGVTTWKWGGARFRGWVSRWSRLRRCTKTWTRLWTSKGWPWQELRIMYASQNRTHQKPKTRWNKPATMRRLWDSASLQVMIWRSSVWCSGLRLWHWCCWSTFHSQDENSLNLTLITLLLLPLVFLPQLRPLS